MLCHEQILLDRKFSHLSSKTTILTVFEIWRKLSFRQFSHFDFISKAEFTIFSLFTLLCFYTPSICYYFSSLRTLCPFKFNILKVLSRASSVLAILKTWILCRFSTIGFFKSSKSQPAKCWLFQKIFLAVNSAVGTLHHPNSPNVTSLVWPLWIAFAPKSLQWISP